MKANWKKFLPGEAAKSGIKLNTHYLVTDAHGQVGIGVYLGGTAWGTGLCGANVVAFAELPEAFTEATSVAANGNGEKKKESAAGIVNRS